MNVWLVRGGRQGEFEERFLGEGCIYLTWKQGQDCDLADLENVQGVRQLLRVAEPEWPEGKVTNHATQVSAFLFKMKERDLIVMPRKGKGAVAVGEITSAYRYAPAGEFLFRHARSVKWLATECPKSGFDSDLRTAFNGITTIFPIKATNAESRIRTRLGAGVAKQTTEEAVAKDVSHEVDLDESARDQIAITIEQRFKGHDLERLVEAVLRAQGYYTYRSPEGPDKGVDILAAPGSLGFGTPRLCVQVKSTGASVDHPTLSQLVGTMKRVNADQGLLVSWSGFKNSVESERASQFFSVRLWDRDDLVDQVLENYERLDAEIRAELPLKRIWIVAATDAE